MSIAFAYIRVSTIDQADNGHSLATQEAGAKAYWNMLSLQDKYKDLEWGGFYNDEGQSAWKVRFADRKEGKKLIARVKPGDQIIFCRLDRAFRKITDAINQMDEWMHMGIGIHFVDQGLNMDSANGRLVVNVMTVVAQWESDIKSERCKEVHARKKADKQPVNQKIPNGKKLAGTGGNRRFIRDPEQYKFIRLIRMLRDTKGMSFAEISDRIEELAAKSEGRRPIPRVHFRDKREWSQYRVRDCYNKMDELMPDGPPSERRKIWNRSET